MNSSTSLETDENCNVKSYNSIFNGTSKSSSKLPTPLDLECPLQSPDDQQNDLTIQSTISKPEPNYSSLTTYRKRFFILALFSCYSMSNAFQWIQYAIVASIIAPHFDKSALAINFTSVVYMLIYVPGIVPASWLLNRRGLRFCVLLGALGTFLGSTLKCFCRSPDQFWLLMMGQTIVAASQLFIINIPPNLAAVWFPSNELSSATSVGVFGNQLGVALGFVIPPALITQNNVQNGLNELHLYLFMLTLIIFVLIVIFFDDKPRSPPSIAQAQSEIQNSGSDYRIVLKELFNNPDFRLLFVSYGINVGVFYAMSTLLEQIVTSKFPGASSEAGQMGLFLTIAGMFGSVVCGIILDKTHWYKQTTVSLYILSLLGMSFWTGSLFLKHIWPLFFVCIFLGFFMTGYLPIGFEFAAEITYPQPEGTSAGLLNGSAQFLGIILTIVSSTVFEHFGALYANLTFCIALIVGSLLTLRIRNTLNRQNASQLSPTNLSDVRLGADCVPFSKI